VTIDGKKTPIDARMVATGFNLWDMNFPAIEIIGREGRNLGKWRRENRFQAYEGAAVPYFTTIESQMKHMNRLLTEVKKRKAAAFEVTQEANDKFLARMTKDLEDSVFALSSCQTSGSYYFNQHGFNQHGEAAILRPTSTINAFIEAGRIPLSHYDFK